MPFARLAAHALDWAMCAAMYRLQKRHRLNDTSHDELAEYVQRTEPMSREEYYAAPEVGEALQNSGLRWQWPSPVQTAFPQNDRAHVRRFPCARGWSAPTVLFLHALMSASDWGYA